jgi:hypothetical protein
MYNINFEKNMNIGLQMIAYNINNGFHVQVKSNIRKKLEKKIRKRASNTTRNFVICNHHVCNWDANASRMQLCRVFYATAMDFCPLFGCVCNYGATMITFIPTFG